MSAYSTIVTGLNKVWANTLGVAYSAWTGKADPWTLSNIVEDSVQSQVNAAKVSCEQYAQNPQGPVPSYCDPDNIGAIAPGFEDSVRKDTINAAQAIAGGNSSQCSPWDIWCLLQESAGWRFLVTYIWVIPIVLIVIIFIAAFTRGFGEAIGGKAAASV